MPLVLSAQLRTVPPLNAQDSRLVPVAPARTKSKVPIDLLGQCAERHL